MHGWEDVDQMILAAIGGGSRFHELLDRLPDGLAFSIIVESLRSLTAAGTLYRIAGRSGDRIVSFYVPAVQRAVAA